MKNKLFLVLALLLPLMNTACINLKKEKLTYENFSRVQKGMTVQQVTDILGPPKDSISVGIAQIGGTNLIWENKENKVYVQFFNEKVVSKQFKDKWPD